MRDRDFHPAKLEHIAIARPVDVEILELFGFEFIGSIVIGCYGGQLAASRREVIGGRVR